MPSLSPSNIHEESHTRAQEANPEIEEEVETMILDYLVCLAIDQTLSRGRSEHQELEEDIDWLVRPIGGREMHIPYRTCTWLY